MKTKNAWFGLALIVCSASTGWGQLTQTGTASSSGNQLIYAGNVLNNDLIDISQATFASATVTGYTPFGSSQSIGSPDFVLNNGQLGGVTNGGTNVGSAFDLDGVFSVTYNLDTSVNSAGYNLTEIRSFAAHQDNRAGQNYQVLVDYVGDMLGFVPLGTFGVATPGGTNQASQLVLQNAVNPGVMPFAIGVGAIRFDVLGGNPNADVYREFDVAGAAAPVPEPQSIALWWAIASLGLIACGWRRKLAARTTP